MRDDDAYHQRISQIDQNIAHAGERIDGLAGNVNRSINVLTAAHPKGLPREDHDILLSFEALCVESLWRTAWLFHARSEHEKARHCLDVARMLQEAVLQATH